LLKRACLFNVVIALAATGCGSTRTVTKTVIVQDTTKTILEFGYIKSLQRKGNSLELRFDPAWFLGGLTANTAAAEDGAVEPGEPVPNDYYVVDEGHRLLTYRVAPDARVMVLTRNPAGTPITLEQLVQLVNGKNPFPRPLFEPLRTGFWIRVDIDTVRALDQQYRP
jgi:hypothetical protein